MLATIRTLLINNEARPIRWLFEDAASAEESPKVISAAFQVQVGDRLF